MLNNENIIPIIDQIFLTDFNPVLKIAPEIIVIKLPSIRNKDKSLKSKPARYKTPGAEFTLSIKRFKPIKNVNIPAIISRKAPMVNRDTLLSAML